jgi:hypothetical protein
MAGGQNGARLAAPERVPAELQAEFEAAWRELRPGGYAILRLVRRRGHQPNLKRVVQLEEGTRP